MLHGAPCKCGYGYCNTKLTATQLFNRSVGQGLNSIESTKELLNKRQSH